MSVRSKDPVLDQAGSVSRSRIHYCVMLKREIENVMRDYQHFLSRKYTFDEWARYLEMIGEPESSVQTYRGPSRRPSVYGAGSCNAQFGREIRGDNEVELGGKQKPADENKVGAGVDAGKITTNAQ